MQAHVQYQGRRQCVTSVQTLACCVEWAGCRTCPATPLMLYSGIVHRLCGNVWSRRQCVPAVWTPRTVRECCNCCAGQAVKLAIARVFCDTDSDACTAEAVRCVGLFCLLDGCAPEQAPCGVLLLRQALLREHPAVAAVAAQGLTDLAVLRSGL